MSFATIRFDDCIPLFYVILLYSAGSINFSILAARLIHTPDPRHTGSQNAGATNLARTAGRRVGAVVLLLDAARAWGLMFMHHWIAAPSWWPAGAIFMILGNILPVFHRFKGGKGVAMSMGILLYMSPTALLAGLAAMVTGIALRRQVSVGTILYLVTSTLVLCLKQGWASMTVVTWCTIASLVLIAHRTNLKRLMQGTEPRFK